MDIELHELELRYADLRVCTPDRLSQMTASLARHGQQSAVLVLTGDEGRFVLVDGYARVEALLTLGKDQVSAVVLDLSEVDALIWVRGLETTRQRSPLEDGWLIDTLIRDHDFDQVKIAHRLQRSVSWVSRRLGLVKELPESAQNAVREGIVSPHAAMKYLVPLARAKMADCEQLIQGLGHTPVSVRQVERLYLRWRQATPDKRDGILRRPHLALKADAAVAPEPSFSPGDPAAPLVNDLEMIAHIARRAWRRLSEGVMHELDARRRERVDAIATESQQASATLWRLLDMETHRCSTSTSELPS